MSAPVRGAGGRLGGCAGACHLEHGPRGAEAAGEERIEAVRRAPVPALTFAAGAVGVGHRQSSQQSMSASAASSGFVSGPQFSQ